VIPIAFKSDFCVGGHTLSTHYFGKIQQDVPVDNYRDLGLKHKNKG
jgi:hypothetical protein